LIILNFLGLSDVPVMCKTIERTDTDHCDWYSCGEWCLSKVSILVKSTLKDYSEYSFSRAVIASNYGLKSVKMAQMYISVDVQMLMM